MQNSRFKKSDAGKGDDDHTSNPKQYRENFDKIEGFGKKYWWEIKAEQEAREHPTNNETLNKEQNR